MFEHQQKMFIYMPCIFWHDRKGILSIDVLQNNNLTKNQQNISVYKIATASIQKEIRVWNFRFDPIEDEKIKEDQQNENEDQQKENENQQQQGNEDSIVFIEQNEGRVEEFEKENKKEEKVLIELEESKVQQTKNQGLFFISADILV
jgi:hypothetical protein